MQSCELHLQKGQLYVSMNVVFQNSSSPYKSTLHFSQMSLEFLFHSSCLLADGLGWSPLEKGGKQRLESHSGGRVVGGLLGSYI